MHPFNRALVGAKFEPHPLFKSFPCIDLNNENSLSRKVFASAMRYAIQTFKLHLFEREKTIF